ncbi:hypothetical protein TcasGA2_TC009509 [Tribolium castaneum]|uniref:SORL1 Fn3 domain-containing protein n=2 Tax=Tribolium castaneum TaxID=7070 RepID=D6WRX2_TRICA|nr:hypothetical protein TcasGA2_TC009509 [Tribolium castaneum]
MPRSGLVTFLISVAFLIRCFQGQKTETSTSAESLMIDTTTESTKEEGAYIDMEIISIEVLPKIGNAVVLSWGKPLREYDLDWTYGVYYGENMQEALKEPKLTTKDLSAEVANLTFCTQYIFAVGVVDPASKRPHPARNVRTIGTLINELSPPEDLQVEFIPEKEPCLLIKWSASCPNIAEPLGYLVTVHEKNSPRMMLITHPFTTSVELAQTLRVVYGKSYDIKVATDVVGSQPTETVSFKVPHFLQPYKVRLTSRPEGAFVMYWREPFVPYFVDDFFYEVYVYPGRDLQGKAQIYATERPVFQFQGNQSEYTFMVGLRSGDGEFKSYLTDPVAINLLGENVTLSVS